MLTNPFITRLAKDVRRHGGHLFVVGGTVRDHVLGLPTTDFDLELSGTSLPETKKLLRRYGRVQEVGRAFGVFLLMHRGQKYEVALPRRDSQVATGHRGFAVTIDPSLPPPAATQRRDFTINAMMADPLTKTIIDPWNGRCDLRQRILRAVDLAKLGEDPLRLQRALQFAARFQLHTDPATKKILRRLVAHRTELPGDRKRNEWLKLVASAKPSFGIQLATDIGYIPHTLIPVRHVAARLRAVDLFRQLATKYRLTEDERLVGFFAVLFHGRLKQATPWLQAEGLSTPVIKAILRVGKYTDELQARPHPAFGLLHRQARLAWPVTLRTIAIASVASAAKPIRLGTIYTIGKKIWFKPPTLIISGRHLLARGWPPSPIFGRIQNAAEDAFERGVAPRRIQSIIHDATNSSEALTRLTTA